MWFVLLDKECSSVLDIAFIIDSSGSIGRRNWELMKRFVKALSSKLDVSTSATRIAAISYSTNPEVVWRFSQTQQTDMINRVVDRMRYQRGFTYTDKALELADRDLFQTSNGMRLNVPKVSSLKTILGLRFCCLLLVVFLKIVKGITCFFFSRGIALPLYSVLTQTCDMS